MNELPAIVSHLLSAEPQEGNVLATLVTVEGSSYRQPGARLLLTAEGVRIGSISGGCLEEDVWERSRAVRETGQSETVVYDTTSENDLVWGVGLGCHGVVRLSIERLPPRPAWAAVVAENLRHRRATTLAVVWQASDPATLGTRLSGAEKESEGVFREVIRPPPHLAIFGAGDDAQPLLRFAKEIGWRVTIADPRPAFATQLRFSAADDVLCAPAAELPSRADLRPGDMAIVMTHHYVHDLPILGHLLIGCPLNYLGLLGPKKRSERILQDIAKSGVIITPALKAQLRAPAGLDLGGDTPAEVALSILAEMRATLAGRDARPLKERVRPIHDPLNRLPLL